MAVSVLIVEDDRNIAELLQMYLEKEGYAVTVAADGGQGLSKFRSIKPDLALAVLDDAAHRPDRPGCGHLADQEHR